MKRRIAQKVLALSLAAAMMTGVAGCGNDGGTAPGADGSSSAAPEESGQGQSSDEGPEDSAGERTGKRAAKSRPCPR